MSEALIPEAKAVYLCDDVLEHHEKDKAHLMGLFNAIRPDSPSPFPHVHEEFCVFLQLIDAEGDVPAHVEIVNASTLEVIFRTAEHVVVFPHRRYLVRSCFRIRNCRFPEPGVYWVEFYCRGRFVSDHELRLLPPVE